jgi:hypothetical protein
VVAAASFVLLVLVLPQVATGIGLGSLALRLDSSVACGSIGSSGSGSFGSGGSGSGSGSTDCGPPALTATPDTKLADAQSIQVIGTGFSPNSQISIAECKAGATSQAGCDPGTLLETTSNGSGFFITQYTVSRLINTSALNGTTESTDCAVDSCILGAGDSASLAAAAAVTPISFNPKIPPVFTVTVAPVDKVNDGGADITGTFVCRRPQSVQIFVLLDQHRGRFNIENENFSQIACQGHKKWTVVVPPGYIGVFGPGKATVSLGVSTQLGGSFREVEMSEKIKLEAGAAKK